MVTSGTKLVIKHFDDDHYTAVFNPRTDCSHEWKMTIHRSPSGAAMAPSCSIYL